MTLRDLVYFGTVWQLLNKETGAPPIMLGAGYANARIERTDDGLFFAGIVERLNSDGRVTDVVLAFAGAQGVGDFIQGNLLARDRVWGEPLYAAMLLERVWNEPRYADARLYVTGHSLGAGYAQFAGTAAIARHGSEAVAARVTIVGFGVPNWGPQSARHFKVGPDVLDRVFTGYTALNDPVITNGGTRRVGVSYFLPPFTGLTGFAAAANRVAAHWPTTYMTAIGLPDWLSARQKAAYVRAVSALFITGRSDNPDYGAAQAFPTIVQGSGGRDTIRGTAGDDLIAGMGGGDVLRGGGGRDRFLLLAASDSDAGARTDTIADFGAGDRIDLSRLDADATRPGQQPFARVASRPFTAPGQVTSWSDGAATWVAGNTDGDGDAEVLIRLHDRHSLPDDAFVLAPQPEDQMIEPFVRGKASILRATAPTDR